MYSSAEVDGDSPVASVMCGSSSCEGHEVEVECSCWPSAESGE